MRVVFMGSPAFAIPTLEALATACTVVGVVTQPDRPAGRGSRLQPPPVKITAQELGIPIFQPERLHDSVAIARLAQWAPGLIVVAAFGQLLPPALLDMPPYGCLNLHASLLPRWRGAAPIPAAILAGDPATGITVMRMDEGLDTGPIILQQEEPIQADDTTGTLTERLAQLAAAAILETLPPYIQGALAPQPQPEEGITYCQQLTKKDGRIDWHRPALELARQVRAMDPWPGAFTTWQGQRLKILQAYPLPDWRGPEPPGTVIEVDDKTAVATGDGALQLLAVQQAGRKALDIEAFICGRQDCMGGVLGE
ncbi:MAG: methionyl-tRNA formyltransferase [Anaerolineae bacterium]|nr:methionyl-tRNA formyltransferase [Anaerolineae bacterium]